jgi:LysM repeat protein
MRLLLSWLAPLVFGVLLVAGPALPAGAAPDAGAAVEAGLKKGKKKKAKKKKARKKKRKKHVQWHLILPGETLGSIAELYGVAVSDIRRWNKLDKDLIRAGRKLKVLPRFPVRARRRINYVVRRGDSIGKLAKRFDLSIKQIKRLNGLKSNMIIAGQELTIYAAKGSAVALPVGAHNAGKLVNGERMPPGPGYVVRNPRESYGTSSTIDHLLRCFAKLRKRDRGNPPFVVGDLSRKRGGKFPPHASHQNGLDVDMGYVPTDRKHFGRFFKATRGGLDARRTFRLFKGLIDTGEVEYIFADTRIQKRLYNYAKRHYSRAQLDKLFQYPRSKHHRVGIIRHAKGHDDHFHLRFRMTRRVARAR